MGEKILLIEDNREISLLYTESLEKAGYNVTPALSGEQGLEFARSEPFDLILLDIMLPQKSGLDVLKELKADPKASGVPVYMLTVLGQESVIKEAFELGAAGYFMKASYAPKDVVREVKNVFAQTTT
jgi:DNA-binding response OmpR family regulator